MAETDSLLKRLVSTFMLDFARWLLGTAVQTTRPLQSELPGTTVQEGTTMPPHVLTRMTIASRLLWSFLVIALVPLSIVTSLTYTISDQSLREEVTHSLRAIADSKANQIETYARER